MTSINTGTAGWSIPKQSAADLPSVGTHLERYSQVFRCAEINSSFYRPHRISTWAKWAASVPGGFRFSVKAPKAITHEARLACTREQLQAFLDQASILAEKLGPILFQLPPKFAFEPVAAEAFLTLLRDLHPGPVVFEPRHATWFSSTANDLLQRFRIARAAADPTAIEAATAPGGWTGLVYYRLHGSPRVYYSPYSEEYLTTLAASIRAQQVAAAETAAETEVWCIFDNTASGAALGNAHRLQQLTSSKPAR